MIRMTTLNRGSLWSCSLCLIPFTAHADSGEADRIEVGDWVLILTDIDVNSVTEDGVL
jgi:hypothetical protein